MTYSNVRPEVEQRLRELAEKDSCSLGEAIADYIANGEKDEWMTREGRRVFEENAEFFKMLGNR